MHEDGLGLGCFTSQSPFVYYICSDLSLHPSISCKCLHSMQEGQAPAVLASVSGHFDLVDVLVEQYGCSMSDEEVNAVCRHL